MYPELIGRLTQLKNRVQSLEDTLRRGLFASAYGPTYYRGFVDSAGVGGVQFGLPTVVAEAAPGLSRRQLAVVSASLAVAMLIGAGACGALAVNAKSDYDATPYQRQAFEARQKLIGYSAAAGVGAVLAVAGGVASWWFFASSSASVAVGAGAGSPSVFFSGRW